MQKLHGIQDTRGHKHYRLHKYVLIMAADEYKADRRSEELNSEYNISEENQIKSTRKTREKETSSSNII